MSKEDIVFEDEMDDSFVSSVELSNQDNSVINDFDDNDMYDEGFSHLDLNNPIPDDLDISDQDDDLFDSDFITSIA